MKLLLCKLFFCLILLQAHFLYGQSQSSAGIPFISNFSPEEYEADPQNWFISQDKQGLIYVANTLGLLRFDGVEWTKIELPNIICRSVITDDKGVVYVGSQGDIGFLKADSLGHLVYSSLLKKIPVNERNFADVWSTFFTKQGIFFYATTKLFLLKNNEVKVFKAPKKFNFCFSANDVIYSQDDSLGLCQIANNQLSVCKNGAFFLGKESRGIMPYKDGKILITTLKHGLIVYNPQTGEATNLESNITQYLTDNLVFCGHKLSENRFGIGTFRGGLVIVDDKGGLVQIINEEKGLRNNSVREIYVDAHHGIWLALNNGIARIEINSPLSIFDKRNGLKGNINHVTTYNNQLFVGTSLGLFYTDKLTHETGYNFAGFRQVPNFADQSTRLLQVDNELLIASNRGTFIYTIDNKIINRSPNGAFVHLPITLGNKKYILAGLRNGVEVFDHDGKQWTFNKTLVDISGEIRTIVQDKNGEIWASTKVNGVYRIKFTNDINNPEIKEFTQKNGLPSDKQTKVFLTSSGVIFGTVKGFYRFNDKKQLFEFDKSLKIPLNLSDNQETWHLYEEKNGNLWVFSGRYKAIFLKQKDGSFVWNYAILSRIPAETFADIFEQNNIIWISTSNALYSYDKDYYRYGNQNFSVLFRRISLINGDSVIAGSHYEGMPQKLSFKNNSLSFDFAATHFDNTAENLYQYQLEGYEKTWSSWTHEPKKDYTNLWNGNYKIKVRAKNIYGEVSNEADYEFVISPPWYRTNVAYLLYVVIFVFLLQIIIRYYTSRLARQNKKLEELVQLRTAEIHQQKEEIESQRDNLVNLNDELASQKSEVEKSYNKMQVLNEIGVEITSILSIENIVSSIYDNVNKLMDAPVFAAGIYNEQRKKLEFYGINDSSKKMVYSSDNIDDNTKLSTWCYNNQQEIFINNITAEAQNYVKDISTDDEISNSLIYIPLTVKGKNIGVVTVQSYQKNAYNAYQRTIFENLVTYISIALDNASSYNLISLKNQQITDSIRYAETIQKAILPTTQELFTAFDKNYFIFYQAKDVVSGDFYWLSIQNEKTVFVATVDCTGHGVPGAFMSLIGATLLNEIVEQKEIHSPAKIITTLHTEIRNVLRQREMANRDGMDLCLCKLEKEEGSTKLIYAGAKRPLYRVNKENILEQINGTHKSVGGGNKEHIEFAEFSYQLQAGEMIYLTTDGYTDQNNANNDKLGSIKLKTTLSEIANLDIQNQQEHISQLFNTHKGLAAQRDDVTVMGIRIV